MPKRKKIMISEKPRSRLVKVDLLFTSVDLVTSHNELNHFFFTVSFIIFRVTDFFWCKGVTDLLAVNLIIKNTEAQI